MTSKQNLKQGEKILFGIAAAFIIVAIIGYVLLETVRLTSDEAMFESKTSFTLSPPGHRGSELFRHSGCTACHRAMRNGTNMGLSLDGVGSVRTQEWLYEFLRFPEQTYTAVTFDHGAPPKEAAYVANMADDELYDIAVFISELKSEQGSASAPMPPEGGSAFIDSMLKTFAPKEWDEKYQDVRERMPKASEEE